MKKLLFVLVGLLFAVYLFGQDVEARNTDITVYGDVFTQVNFTGDFNVGAGAPVVDSDTSFYYRGRVGLYGDINDKYGFHIRFKTSGPFAGTVSPTWTFERLYIAYYLGENGILYIGRHSLKVGKNDLLFDTTGKHDWADGLLYKTTFADGFNFFAAYDYLTQNTGGGDDNTIFYLGFNKKFDKFCLGLGYLAVSDPTLADDYGAFSVKLGAHLTDALRLHIIYLNSNGDDAYGMPNADTSAFEIGFKYALKNGAISFRYLDSDDAALYDTTYYNYQEATGVTGYNGVNAYELTYTTDIAENTSLKLGYFYSDVDINLAGADTDYYNFEARLTVKF